MYNGLSPLWFLPEVEPRAPVEVQGNRLPKRSRRLTRIDTGKQNSRWQVQAGGFGSRPFSGPPCA